MFSAGLTGYNVTRGLMGALKTRAPGGDLVDALLEVPDLDGCLRHLRAIPFLEGIEIGARPGDLEKALLAACAEFARKIRNFLGGSAGKFIETYMQRFHIHNAKLVFKSVLEGAPEEVLDLVYPVSARYDPAVLARLKDGADVVSFFGETKIGACLAEAHEVYRANDDDLSLFELVLDRSYINMLWRAGERVKFGDGRRLRRNILLPWLASTAILWVLWLAHYRAKTVEEVTALADLPDELLPARIIRDLVETGDPSAAAAALGNRKLREFFSGEGLQKDLISLHRMARRFAWRLVLPARRSTRFDVSTLLAALMCWEFIVDDAITVTGARAVGLSGEEITSLLATRAA